MKIPEDYSSIFLKIIIIMENNNEGASNPNKFGQLMPLDLALRQADEEQKPSITNTAQILAQD
jgi:hypothetical protein